MCSQAAVLEAKAGVSQQDVWLETQDSAGEACRIELRRMLRPTSARERRVVWLKVIVSFPENECLILSRCQLLI
jgi:hypothetical protein